MAVADIEVQVFIHQKGLARLRAAKAELLRRFAKLLAEKASDAEACLQIPLPYLLAAHALGSAQLVTAQQLGEVMIDWLKQSDICQIKDGC